MRWRATPARSSRLGCETDFVARTDEFQRFAKQLAAVAIEAGADAVEALGAATLDGESVAQRIAAVAGKLGENVVCKRVARLTEPDGLVGGYVHAGGKLGVLVGVAHDRARRRRRDGGEGGLDARRSGRPVARRARPRRRSGATCWRANANSSPSRPRRPASPRR